jgi:hypothetical protein
MRVKRLDNFSHCTRQCNFNRYYRCWPKKTFFECPTSNEYVEYVLEKNLQVQPPGCLFTLLQCSNVLYR